MSRKLVVTLVLILFLLPFVSWYYLKRGLEWRKDVQQIMNGTSPFPEQEWVDADGRKFSTDILDNQVTLVSQVSCENHASQTELLDKLYDQFKETGKAHFFILDRCGTLTLPPGATRTNWHVIDCQDSLKQCNALLTAWPPSTQHALIDRKKIIRSYYPGTTDDEKRVLLEHMALLIPRERSDKVELKRGHNK